MLRCVSLLQICVALCVSFSLYYLPLFASLYFLPRPRSLLSHFVYMSLWPSAAWGTRRASLRHTRSGMTTTAMWANCANISPGTNSTSKKRISRSVADHVQSIPFPKLITRSYFCKTQIFFGREYECAALIKACEDGKQKLVDELIQAGADLNATDEVCISRFCGSAQCG